MKRYLMITAALCLLIALTSCAQKRVYTKGKYIEPEKVILLSDKFVESDLQRISDRLSGSLLQSDLATGKGKRPAIIISLFTNGTDEHIDMLSLTSMIRTELIKSGKFRFLNERLRKSISDEYDYQNSGIVDPATAKSKGHQIGADWMISGHIAAIKQPVGRREIVYYKVTMEVTDIKTSEMLWADEVQLKKQFVRRKVRP
jgi:uncharacterized protein (TIGR02722 family)